MAVPVASEPIRPPSQPPTLQAAFSGPQAPSQGPVGYVSPSLSDYGNLYTLAQTTNLPQTVAADNQIANLYNRVGLTGAQTDLARQNIQRGAQFDRERLGMNRDILGEQKEDLAARRGDIEYWHNRQLQNFMGGQAARGATHTEGTTRGIGDFENERARLLRQLGMDERQLGRTTRGLGIQEEELGFRVQNALEKLGLDQAINVSDIFSAITDIEAGKFNPLSQILGQIYQLSGIRPLAQQQTSGFDTPKAATQEARVR